MSEMEQAARVTAETELAIALARYDRRVHEQAAALIRDSGIAPWQAVWRATELVRYQIEGEQ